MDQIRRRVGQGAGGAGSGECDGIGQGAEGTAFGAGFAQEAGGRLLIPNGGDGLVKQVSSLFSPHTVDAL